MSLLAQWDVAGHCPRERELLYLPFALTPAHHHHRHHHRRKKRIEYVAVKKLFHNFTGGTHEAGNKI